MAETRSEFESDLKPIEYAIISKIQGDLGRKFDALDLFDHEEREFLTDAAEIYARTYRGTFEFMLDMRQAFRKNGYLSEKMARGVLNCAVAEYNLHIRRIEEQERAREVAKFDHPAHGPH